MGRGEGVLKKFAYLSCDRCHSFLCKKFQIRIFEYVHKNVVYGTSIQESNRGRTEEISRIIL